MFDIVVYIKPEFHFIVTLLTYKYAQHVLHDTADDTTHLTHRSYQEMLLNY